VRYVTAVNGVAKLQDRTIHEQHDPTNDSLFTKQEHNYEHLIFKNILAKVGDFRPV